MLFKNIFILSLILIQLNALTCSIDKRIMYAIIQVEKHPNRSIGYNYLISFNEQEDVNMANNIYPFLFIDNRTIDCQSSFQCADILYNLKNYGITNLDCGAYQINTKFHTMDNYEDYFILKKSYEKACKIVESHTKDELSWINIAKYHSKTKKYNKKYKEKLFKVLEKFIDKK